MYRNIYILILLILCNIIFISAFNYPDIWNYFSTNSDDKNSNSNHLNNEDTISLFDQFIQYNKNNGILGDSKTNPEAESQFISKVDKDGNGLITSFELRKVIILIHDDKYIIYNI